MRFVDRTKHDCPGALKDQGRKGQKELAAARDWFAPIPVGNKAPVFAAYKDDEVKLRLEAMFHGKCAYCETRYAISQPMDVEHYRPKGRVAEDPDHSGYWWLAMAWENLLPSCIDCNRQRSQILVDASASLESLAEKTQRVSALAGKKDSFPLAAGGVHVRAEGTPIDDERALLLDPCRDRPQQFLAFSFTPGLPLGVAIPVGDSDQQLRGAASIQVYGLNRLQLVQERTRVLRHLAFLEDLVIELSQSIEELDVAIESGAADTADPVPGPLPRTASRLRLLRDRTLAEMSALGSEDAPYSAMTNAWLDAFRLRLAN